VKSAEAESEAAESGAADEAERRKAAEARGAPRAAERRQLTILRCGLAAGLDPEDLQGLIAGYQEGCARAIGAFGGTVARMMNDEVVAYFGYPAADEHDAERAIRAGLEVGRAVAALDGRLQARIGIASGPVVIGGEGEAPAALGEAAETAARLAALAGPGEVVISAACRQLAGGLFALRAAGEGAFRVVGARAVESRFAALRAAGAAPLVGRAEELALLLRRWEQARAGNGRVVLIEGEAGIGKSRLASELRVRLAGTAHATAICSCAPHRQDSAYHPFIDYLERAAGFCREDDEAARARKLAALLGRSGADAEAVALIGDLLAVRTGGGGLALAPRRRRERTCEALVAQVAAVAARVPVLLIFEDAHWIDPTSREVLDALVDRVAGMRVLLVVTGRAEFVPAWASRAHAGTIVLNGLDRSEAETMIAALGGGAIPEEARRRIIAHADGVPLFVEELARAVAEDAGGAAAAVPRTLQSSLIARLDRMTEGKVVAQVGAVIGREFPHHLLASVAGMAEAALRRGLGELEGARLVLRRGEAPEAMYSFRHALLRDAAYETLLRGRRQALHGAIARALMGRAAAGEEVLAEILGQHCERAGMAAEAARFYLEAGERSAARSALAEARAHLARGLAAAEGIPEAHERALRQAELMLAMGNVQFALHGLASREHGAAFADAIALCRALGAADRHAAKLLARALYGEWLYRLFAGQVAASRAIGEELSGLAAALTDPEIRVMGAGCLGTSCFFLGRLDEAVEIFAALGEESEAGARARPMIAFGIDARTALQRARSRVLACQGRGAEARAEARASLEKARELRHMPTIAMALAVACDTAWLLDERDALEAASVELVRLASEQGFRFWLARGKAYRGWVAAKEGRAEEGRALIEAAIGGLDGSGIKLFGPQMRALLADVHAGAGRTGAALVLIEAALAMARETGETWLEAELLRRKGELDPGAAEACFGRAIRIARGQSARLFELRVIASQGGASQGGASQGGASQGGASQGR
jgi:predicted ATPase/class 3 adenylate cyclase